MPDKVRAWAATHVGRVRRQNEDSCLVGAWRSRRGGGSWRGNVPNASLWAAVADGMGGHMRGEVASALVIDCIAELIGRVAGEDDIHQLLFEANTRLFQAMAAPGGSPAMGSTVVGFVAGARHGWIFNVGDSRAYVVAAGRLHRVSEDHTPGRSVTGVRSHALTQSLGGTLTPRPLTPHVVRLDLASIEAILLCSDGLTDMVEDEEIEALMLRVRDDPANALVEAALEAGGVDNVTVAVLRLLGDSRRTV